MQQAILDLIDKHIYWLSVVNTEWEPQEEYHSEWQLSLMKLRKDVVALWDGWIPVTERLPDEWQTVLIELNRKWISYHTRIFIKWEFCDSECWYWMIKSYPIRWMPLPNSPKQ